MNEYKNTNVMTNAMDAHKEVGTLAVEKKTELKTAIEAILGMSIRAAKDEDLYKALLMLSQARAEKKGRKYR